MLPVFLVRLLFPFFLHSLLFSLSRFNLVFLLLFIFLWASLPELNEIDKWFSAMSVMFWFQLTCSVIVQQMNTWMKCLRYVLLCCFCSWYCCTIIIFSNFLFTLNCYSTYFHLVILLHCLPRTLLMFALQWHMTWHIIFSSPLSVQVLRSAILRECSNS